MHTATYSPDDNKLRLYPAERLDPETYQRVKAAGFKWAPRQGLFVAPAWTPSREDLLLELCGEIGDEDTSLVDRAEERAERFEGYSDRRMQDAEQARQAVSAIADNIPLGQPILVGHHSERRARKDAEKIERGMERAVRMWRTSEYWTDRAAGALRHAKYKERPDVRARRIKKIESERRKVAKQKDRARTLIDIERANRWLEHYDNRLAYERAMLDEAGGIEADRTKPEKGGACRCWAGPRGGWAYIQRVNKVSVTVLDNWGNGGANFTRTIPFDKLMGLMTAAEVETAREAGRLVETEDGTGFYLRDTSPETPPAPKPAPGDALEGAQIGLG